MESNNNIRTYEVLKKIDSYLNLIKDDNRFELSDKFRKATFYCRDAIDRTLKVVQEEEENDFLRSWQEVLKNIDSLSKNNEEYMGGIVVFIYMVIKEILIQGGGHSKASEGLDYIKKAINYLKESDYGGFDYIEKSIKNYDEYYKFIFMSERVTRVNKIDLDRQVKKVVGDNSREVEKIKNDIATNRDILEGIENNTGFTSLFSGLNDYSKKLNKSLRGVENEIKALKYLLLLAGLMSLMGALMLDVSYGYYIGTVSVMGVLGLFLKVNLRKEDQYQQLLAKVENRIAISIFHKYRLSELEGDEAINANQRFHGFIYSELETSDWNAPDISESIASIVKAIKN